jgi:SIT4-associating protein SAP185/190
MIFPNQTSPDTNKTTSSIPPPLNIPPSRARRQLAARLAAKKAEAANNDPDAADNAALEVASTLPTNPGEEIRAPDDTITPPSESGLEVSGLRTMPAGGASRFSGLFGGSDDSSSSGDEVGFDEDDAGRDLTIGRDGGDYEDTDGGWAKGRIPSSTTAAKERTPLSDEEEDEDLGPELDAKLVLEESRRRGPFADPVGGSDSSEEEELVEIRPRRTS